MGRWLSPRFGAEAAFLFAVAAVLYLLEAGRAAIVGGMFVAWLVVAALEVLGSRGRAGRARTEAEAARAGAPGLPPDLVPAGEEEELYVEPAAARPGDGARAAVGQKREVPEQARPLAGAEPLSPPGREEETGGEEGERVPEAEPFSPGPEREDEPAEAVEDFPPPPPPPVLTALPSLEEEEEAPLAEPEPEPEPQVVELRPAAPREWNLWELERLVRERSGGDPMRDEERAYLLMYLREFAAPDGVLPLDFDSLVRESFGDLIAAAR